MRFYWHFPPGLKLRPGWREDRAFVSTGDDGRRGHEYWRGSEWAVRLQAE